MPSRVELNIREGRLIRIQGGPALKRASFTLRRVMLSSSKTWPNR